MADEPDNVIQFVPLAQLEAQRDEQQTADYIAAARAEAIDMLEEALRFAREDGRVCAVAIGFSFVSGAYATQFPAHGYQMGALSGAVATLGFRIQMAGLA